MKKYIIDTNALISFVTDRNPAQQKQISWVFEDAAALKAQVLCPQNVLTEFVYVMDKLYHVAKNEIRDIFYAFTATPGMNIVHDINLNTLLKLWPESIADYGDAIVATLGTEIRGAVVTTFDRRLHTALKKAGIAVLTL